MNILRIKKIRPDVEIPVVNSYGIFDIRIDSFHKINDYEGIISTESNTIWLQSQQRIMIKTGYSLHTREFPKWMLKIISRIPCAIKDGLVVLGGEQYWYLNNTSKEIEIILYNSSDRAFVLQRGFRVAQGLLTQVHESRIENIE